MATQRQGLILLVDDNVMQRRLYGDVLTTQGYTVFAAATVKEAEQVLLSNHPAIIVLDIMMPVIDGIEACRRFRKTLGDRVPILFLTAADTMDMVLEAMKAGGDDYIVKSGSPVTLVERIKHWRLVPHAELPGRRAKVVAYLEARSKPGTLPRPPVGPRTEVVAAKRL